MGKRSKYYCKKHDRNHYYDSKIGQECLKRMGKKNPKKENEEKIRSDARKIFDHHYTPFDVVSVDYLSRIYDVPKERVKKCLELMRKKGKLSWHFDGKTKKLQKDKYVENYSVNLNIPIDKALK